MLCGDASSPRSPTLQGICAYWVIAALGSKPKLCKQTVNTIEAISARRLTEFQPRSQDAICSIPQLAATGTQRNLRLAKKVLNRFPRMRSLNRTPDSSALTLFAEPQYP